MRPPDTMEAMFSLAIILSLYIVTLLSRCVFYDHKLTKVHQYILLGYACFTLIRIIAMFHYYETAIRKL